MHRATPTLLALLLSGCDAGAKPEDPACEPIYGWRDDDGDGYGDPDKGLTTCDEVEGVATSTDCDDGNADVFPGAPESCTVPVDANCDGYLGIDDHDDDGTRACEDCDDGDATRNPRAAELCDGVDQDCDGAIDEDAVDPSTWYLDGDGDGHGIGLTVVACDRPDGYAEVADDCDDGAAGVYPDAPEYCNDLDDDCDGATDEASAVDLGTWYPDADEDGWGDPDGVAHTCDAPFGYLAAGGDCDDADPAIHPEATEVCNAADDDCDGTVDGPDALDAQTWYTDYDGDGYGDADEPVLGCEADHLSLSPTDCDDARRSTHPGAREYCDGDDDDCNGLVDDDGWNAETWYGDADGDGYGDASVTAEACDAPAGMVADDSDCDDTDGATSPAAAESCNGSDDDCDDDVDEDDAVDAATWYTDADGDGFGDPAAASTACAAPSGHVADGTDCDDADAAISPDADELCGGVDEDCDGTESEPDAADTTAWYADADGDNDGDPSVVTFACDAPAGTVIVGTDCDDTDAAYHTGAAEADCGDPNDYNCDGSTGLDDRDGDGHAACEECDDSDAAVFPGAVETCNTTDDDCDGAIDEVGALGGADWYPDVDADGFGDPDGVALPACSAIPGYALPPTDCDDADAAVNPEAAEDCATAHDDDCDGDSADQDALGCTDWFEDRDGDGHASATNACLCAATDTFAYTAPGGDCGDDDADVHPGGTEAWANGVDDDCDGDTDGIDVKGWADATLRGQSYADRAGQTVAAAGDVNGDGYADLFVGAPDASPRVGMAAGSAFLVLGPADHVDYLAAGEAIVRGDAPYDHAGYALGGAGDVDADGYGDLLLGAIGSGAGGQGAAFLFRGPVTGEVAAATADATWTGTNLSDLAGYAVALGPDVSGDGLDDVIIGAPYSDTTGASAGSVYLLPGLAGSGSVASGFATLTGEAAGDEAGYTVAIAGDLDGDGVGDVLVGAPTEATGGTGAGAVYVLYGPVIGAIGLGAADGKLTGISASDAAGGSLCGPGDIDGDGLDDVLVGAATASGNGTAYLVNGPATGTLSLRGADAFLVGAARNDSAGASVAGAGDTNGDGARDLLVGAPGADTNASAAGTAYLVYGPVAGVVGLGSADMAFYGTSLADRLGVSVAGVGDTDADGLDDILFGASGSDLTASEAGIATLFLGR